MVRNTSRSVTEKKVKILYYPHSHLEKYFIFPKYTQFKASKENISFSVRTKFFSLCLFSHSERLFFVFIRSTKQYENYLLFFYFSFELLMAHGYLYPHFISFMCRRHLASCYITIFFLIMYEWCVYVKPYLLTGNGTYPIYCCCTDIIRM